MSKDRGCERCGETGLDLRSARFWPGPGGVWRVCLTCWVYLHAYRVASQGGPRALAEWLVLQPKVGRNQHHQRRM